MILGTKLWDNRDTFSVQTNNSIETILRKWSGKSTGYLETCGPTSAINILDSMRCDTSNHSKTMASIQSEDFLTVWMNDPKNIPNYIQDGTMVNEVAAAYPNAVQHVFGATCRYLEGQNFDWVSSMLKAGHGVMLNIKLSTGGHFVAAVAFDDVAKEIIYRDPWPNRTGTDGYNLRMSRSMFEGSVKPYCVVFEAV